MHAGLDAVILAGGLGTRLRSVINETPKCLAEVNNLPFLTYKIGQLKEAGIARVILCVGYMADQIERYFTENPIAGVNIVYAHEEALLGTAGAFKNAEPYIETEHFLALNGDVYFDINTRHFIEGHLQNNALASLALARVDDPSRYGLVLFNANREIQAFLEKQPLDPAASPETEYYINAGTYCFHRSLLERIPVGVACSVEREVFPNIIGQGFYAYPSEAYFIDIGTPESYQQIETDIRSGRLTMAY